MVYHDRYGHDKHREYCEFCDGRRYWGDEQDPEGVESDLDGVIMPDKDQRKPCFFDEKKCKFEFPFKVIVKVVPVDDCRHDKKFF